MKITKEQFEEIGPFYMDDLPFDDANQNLMFQLFNALPDDIRSIGISWDCNDTVFRDNAFVFLCKNQFGMTVEEYYASDIFKEYSKNGKLVDIDFKKLEL